MCRRRKKKITMQNTVHTPKSSNGNLLDIPVLSPLLRAVKPSLIEPFVQYCRISNVEQIAYEKLTKEQQQELLEKMHDLLKEEPSSENE